MIEWLDHYAELAYWAQATAIMLTGIFAILAAWIALTGAKRQANAVLETSNLAYDGAVKQAKAAMASANAILQTYENTKEDTAANAITAITAEICNLVKQLNDSWQLGVTNRVFASNYFLFIKTGFPVFDSDPSIVARLPASEIPDVIAFYQGLRGEWTLLEQTGLRPNIAEVDYANMEVRVKNLLAGGLNAANGMLTRTQGSRTEYEKLEQHVRDTLSGKATPFQPRKFPWE